MGKYEKDNTYKRAKIIASFMVSIFLSLMVRLYFIQMVKGEKYQELAMNQQIFNIESSLSRGIIFDRNGKKFTNQDEEKVLYIFKKNIKDNKKNIEELKKALKYSNKEIEKLLNSSDSVIEISLDNKDVNLDKLSNIKDVVIVDKQKRNNDKNILAHVIGYINEKDNIGLSGIEKAFDKEPLKANINHGKTPIFVDAKQRVIPGVSADIGRGEVTGIANSLKLTIDYDIQEKTEEILDKSRKKGAVVVSEVDSGDIIAMASRPNVDLTNIKEELNKHDQRFFNKSLELSYPPGSIFKVPVLLAALEKDEVSLEDKIFCKGYEEVENTIINCNKKGGHGEITVFEGLYNSCNSTFIQIGKKIGAEEIVKTAKVLGFGEKINIGLEDESKGNLPKGKDLVGPAIGNISIGQGNIEVTPLQVTNMMMIVANGGVKKDMSIVDSYVTAQGAHGKKIRRESDQRVLSEDLVNMVKKGLDEVVQRGTASNIEMRSIGGGGGKTGSAQAVLNGKETVHAWFTGYFPKDKPKYVITVFIESGDSGSTQAAPVFEKVAKEIYKIENKK
ncbi:sporulation-specific penicillin-binding protein [Gottschalkia acidurici 9a]|uniref:beta-lactamase n=1 Tax=Gottschalkia acidurici (strain ATCC 7906 / DSM 604 / BCRC 14475 / CIP 104303 / KCTC 5404 / NCIMB 10678 / 9a) TaxID=1128398 RepID=K0AZZ4_GOTA9|nr:penicillin-binding transpeptidase domain-containing protein [Gottschalkia acidurici]AFS78357.1 sporulation-specific penicillin-binding protein [Gottschalkia acidurici 9a]